MTEKDRLDYLTIMVAKLVQMELHERHTTGNYGTRETYQGLVEMFDSLQQQDCVKNAPRIIHI